MAAVHMAAIGNPEFINIKPYNPLISECEIKVFYLGENRNKSVINKTVAMEMANTLPGCPIVGQFKKEKNDFGDHGDKITYDSDGVHFECMTRPYGFVAPNAKVWFQKFEEIDDNGKQSVREYLMTTGFLWTGQYPECQAAVDEGKPHSMEIDEDTLDGVWTKNYNSGINFFIINDAIFSKLCILGDDVEPCFEGSTITAPKISNSFSMDKEFTHTLYTMMQDLKFALQEGGQKDMEQKFSESQDKFEKVVSAENEDVTEGIPNDSFVKKDEEKTSKEEAPVKKEDEPKKENKEDSSKEGEKPATSEDEDEKNVKTKNAKCDDEEKKKFSLLEEEHQTLKNNYEALQTQFSELTTKFEALQAFKNSIEDEKKDSLIKSFYMLSDEDKKDVIENKAKYSLEDIESKLSVICVRKRVNFDLDNEKTEEVTPVTTFSLDEQGGSAPAWITAVMNTQKSRNI